MSQPIRFGKYLLLDRVNVGGMAEVFKAKAFGVEGFERVLAIKRILPNMAEDDEFINMFVDEARIAVQLNHPNIVQIHELGRFETQYYIAMEYVSGKDLRQVLDFYRKRDETMPVEAAALITSQICEGLDYAHRKTDPSGKPLNLIHRDVSPQNILMGYDGHVKITDFGIAKAEDRASKTQAGVLKGKFGYMSPEQVRGMTIDNRSDIFAVGILLYEMVTGKRLFVGESDFSTLEKVRAGDVTPPREHNPDISEELETVMLKALAKERDDRYAHASELVDDLQQFLIKDNAIFNAKSLAGLLSEHYADDITAEQKKMEEYATLRPPEMAPADMGGAAPGGLNFEDAAEKTTIFESGFALDAPGSSTQIATEYALGGVGSPAPIPAEPSQVSGTSRLSAAERARLAAAKRRKSVIYPAVAVFGTVLLLLAGVFAVLGGGETGSIVVTSTPVTEVQIYLDGDLIGENTPLSKDDVELGQHTLIARASGYGDKAYRFDLVAGAPAVIAIELQPMAGTGGAAVEVVSDPAGASVRIGGLPQGVTPLTLKGQDATRPVILEVGKAGYKTQVVTVAFKSGETRKRVKVSLKPTAQAVAEKKAAAAAAGADQGEPAKLQIKSEPAGAAVTLNGKSYGNTPTTVGDLRSKGKYKIELLLAGYKRYSNEISLNGQTNVVLEATLTKRAPRAACSGSGGRLSVNAVGVGNCKVMVGKSKLGFAPFALKRSPTGKCPIEVTCPGGRRYRVTRRLKPNQEERIIIKANDWQ